MKIRFDYNTIKFNRSGSVVLDVPKGRCHLTMAFHHIAKIENTDTFDVEITKTEFNVE